MVASIQILRSIVSGNRPAGRVYGEPYVNLADNQFGVFDSSNVARDLLGVPVFSASKSYVAGNPVNYQGNLYIALVAVTAGAWNSAQWGLVSGSSSPPINVLIFTASGTYTPSANLLYSTIECLGGGGGGGGIGNSPATGLGGGGGGSGQAAATWDGGVGATLGTAGDIRAAGAPGGAGAVGGNGYPAGGIGGSNVFGGGGRAWQVNAAGAVSAGVAGSNYGSGGSGAVGYGTTATAVGGAGSHGFVIITEYF